MNKTTRELIDLDYNKIKEEDRRFLLSKASQEVISNSQMIMQNNLFIISNFALFASLVALISSSPYINNPPKLITILFFIVGAIVLIFQGVKANKRVIKQNNEIKKSHDLSMKLHFKYALVKKKK